MVLATDELDERGDIVKSTVWLLLVRGDHSLNEVKAGKVDGMICATKILARGFTSRILSMMLPRLTKVAAAGRPCQLSLVPRWTVTTSGSPFLIQVLM